MSTFKGKMSEIQEISIDRFDGHNLQSEAFFLSHCHTDHMHGLQNQNFADTLISKNRFLYLSHVSAEIIKSMYPLLANNLRELDFSTPTAVELKDKTIEVTPIPAGHCPGSVMFLFDTEKNETLLYTGDFRLNPKDLPKFNAFFNTLGTQKQIQALYLDTTFFLKAHTNFPSRAESLDSICKVISDWIHISDKHVIGLHTSAKYGYEYLFLEIYEKFKMPIHVNDEIYEFYSRVPKLNRAVTRREHSTQIHSGCGLDYSLVCPSTPEFKIKYIKTSAFRWNNDQLQNGILEDLTNKCFVCYSTHASYEEIVGLIKFLKPKKIEPNVLSRDLKDNQEIYANIKELMDDDDEPPVRKIKLFKTNSEKKKTHLVEVNRKEDADCCCILDSPPRKFHS